MKKITQIKTEDSVKAALYSLLLAGIFYSSYRVMVGWWASEDYSHCFLIVPIVFYLLWEKREELATAQTRPSWSGLVPLASGLFLFWMGKLAGEFATMYFASWFVLAGLLLLHMGWKKLKVIWFPIVFILAMFPPPQFFHANLTQQLKLISSKLGVAMLQWYGLAAYREGNIIDLEFTQLQVVDACSGLRYLYSLIITAVLLAHFYKAALWKKIVLVLSAIPLTIVTNSLRIAMTGILYDVWGAAVADGFFHGFSGVAIFIFAFAALLLEMWMLRWLPGEKRAEKFNWFDLFHSSNSFKTQQPTNPTNQTNSTNNTGSHQPIEPIKQAVQSEPIEPAASGWKTLLQPPQLIVAVLLLAATLAAQINQ